MDGGQRPCPKLSRADLRSPGVVRCAAPCKGAQTRSRPCSGLGGKGSRLRRTRRAPEGISQRGGRLGKWRFASYCPANLFPQLVAASTRASGVAQDVFGSQRLFEPLQRGLELVVGDAVHFGRYYEMGAANGTQKLAELLVAGLGWNVGIYKRNAQRKSRALLEVGLNELLPAGGAVVRDLGVAVAGQVGEEQVGPWTSGPADGIKIDAASPPWSGTCTRYLVAEKGIDDAGFAYVGAAEKSDLRRRGRGEM